MVKWKRELLLSLFLIAFSLVNFIYCGTMKTDIIKVSAAKPDVYLRLWLGILLALSVVLLYRALKNRPQEVLPKLWGPFRYLPSPYLRYICWQSPMSDFWWRRWSL